MKLLERLAATPSNKARANARIAVTLMTLLATPLCMAAEAYPVRAVRLLVPFAAGGPIDLMARIFARELSESFAQPVVVENRPGGSGRLASEAVLRAEPDGHTLLVISGASHGVLLAVDKSIPYDTLRDFTPVVQIGNTHHALVVSTKLPVQTLQDLITYARTRPGQLNFASPGNGTTGQLAGEWLKSAAGLNLTHVAYKGEAAAMGDMRAGTVHLGFFVNPKPLIEAGAVKVIAVAAPEGSDLFPGLPSLAQAGLKDFGFVGFIGLAGPAGLPAAVAQRINEAALKALDKEPVRRQMMAAGYTSPGANTPAMFAQRIRDDIARWKRVVEQNKLKFD